MLFGTALLQPFGEMHQGKVKYGSTHQSCDGIDKIMGLDVNRSHAEESVERQQDKEQFAIA